MRAAVTTEMGGFDCTTLPDPAPAPDEVVVRVAACGVCGSDLKAHRLMPGGTVMGHEFCGEVVGAGTAAVGWRTGTHVAVLPFVSCGRCAACRAGEVFHCREVRCIGMGAPAGGFAEYAAVPAKHAFALPAGTPPGHGALVEPLAVGLRAATGAAIAAGEDVLVVGAGGVGLAMIAWAKALGAARITVAEPVEERRAVAAAMGATDALPSSAAAADAGYDVVVDGVGAAAILADCVRAARPLGRIVMAGTSEAPVPIPPVSPMLKALTIRYSVASRPEDFRRVIRSIEDGLIDPAPMLGAGFGLAQIDAAFANAGDAISPGRTIVSP